MQPMTPTDMRNLIAMVRYNIRGMSEAAAIDHLADQLNYALIELRTRPLSDAEQTTLTVATVDLFILKGLVKTLLQEEHATQQVMKGSE